VAIEKENEMATHLIVIPGFGMNCLNMDITDIPKEYRGQFPGFDEVFPINPNWGGHDSLEKLAEGVANEINSKYAKFADCGAEHKVVIYGFSLGADLIMEMLSTGSLHLGKETYLVLADPNVNTLTCFITWLAVDSPEKQDFVANIDHKAAGNPGLAERWRNYAIAVSTNIGGQAEWNNCRKLARSVIDSVCQRYERFKDLLKGTTRLASGAQVMVVMSVEGVAALKANCGDLRYPWMDSEGTAQHFDLSDPGQIKGYANRALERLALA